MNTTTDNTQKDDWWTWTIKKVNKPWKDNSCLHDNCSSCGGTGIRKDGLGLCIHMMSCSCSKCSPRM